MKPFLLTNFRRCFLLALSLIGLMRTSQAQTKYFHLNEDFQTFPGGVNVFPYNNWSCAIASGDFTFDYWRFNNPGSQAISAPASGNIAVFDSDNYSSNGGFEDVSLTSPIIDTRGYNSIWVKWAHQFQAGFGGQWNVEIFNGLVWTSVAGGTTQIAWKNDSVDISALAGNKLNARVRMRWRGDYSWWWCVDNIQVFSSVVANNGASLNAVMQAGQCGSATDSIKLTIRNVGSNVLSNIPLKGKVTGTIGGNPINSTISKTYTGSLNPGQIATVNIGGFNTLLGGTIDYMGYTEVGSDPVLTNDTAKSSGYSVFGTPPLPTPVNKQRCGAGTVTLDGGILAGNTGIWYNSASSTTPAWSGSTRTTPLMVPPSSVTYYVSQAKTSSYRTTPTGFGANTWFGAGNPGGNMFTVTAVANIIIDSLAVNINNTSPVNISVYYKQGSYVGFEGNPSAWTLLSTVSRNGAGGNNPSNIKINPLTISAGQTYALYVRSDLEMIFTSGSTTVTNADMSVSGGVGIAGTFGGTATDFMWSGNIYYKIFCESNKVAVTATANPAPANSDFSPVTPFAGTINAGTLADPDIVSPPDVIEYSIITPTGFANSAFGSTWQFSSSSFKTLKGTNVPTADYTISNPGSSANGKVRFTPSTPFIDSTVRLNIILKRLDNGCDTVIERIIYIAPRPKADFNLTNVCDGQQAIFSNGSSIIPSATISFLWNFGDGSTSTLINPTKKYDLPGTYTVKLLTISNLGYKDSMTKSITVFENPASNFTFVNACEGTNITLSDNSTLPTGTPTYIWDFGDLSPLGTGSTTSKGYATPGIYKVTHKVIVNGCENSISKYVTQAPRSVPDFSFTASQCDNAGVAFTNNTPALPFGSAGYTWNFDDGAVSSVTSPTHIYNVFKTYNVKLYGTTNFGCKDSVSKTVVLRESPKPIFTRSASTCTNEPISFTNGTNLPTGTTNTFEWAFGDGDFSTTENPTHAYNAGNSYTVKLKVTNTNGCEGTKDSVITISTKPTAGFTAYDVCEGKTSMFTNNSYTTGSGTLLYLWSFGNSKFSTAQDTSFVYGAPGTYAVSLIAATANGCADTADMSLNVNANPVPVIIIASKLSHDGTFDFTTNTSGSSYVWTFGGGGTSYSKDTTFQFLSSGPRTVTLKITSADGCVGVATQTLFVNPLGIKNPTSIAGQLNVYPNPSNGVFVIDYSNLNDGDIYTMNITDMLGRVVADNIQPAFGTTSSVDMSALSAGIYYLNVNTPEGPFSLKLSVKK